MDCLCGYGPLKIYLVHTAVPIVFLSSLIVRLYSLNYSLLLGLKVLHLEIAFHVTVDGS